MLNLDMLKEVKTPYQAFRMALFLSVTAPDDSLSKKLLHEANQILPFLTHRSVEKAKKEVEKLVALYRVQIDGEPQ